MKTPVAIFEFALGRQTMSAFIRRLAFHYSIYRRYPLAPMAALKNAWRIARL